MADSSGDGSVTMTTVARAVGRILAGHGVRVAFGVVGGGNILTVAGLTEGGIRYVPARHEGGAMAMADAYHRVTGEVAIATTSHGPGLTNLATSLAEAVKHGSGVLVVCGDAPTGGRRPHDIDQTTFAKALGARVVRPTDPRTAGTLAVEALRLARTRRRPVLLCLPNDLLSASVPSGAGGAPGAPATAPRGIADHPVPRGLPAALDALAGARRPLLLAGLGAWQSGAGKTIVELADRIGALLATTVMASGLFAGHPWSLGVCGGFAAPRAARMMADADVVVAFGASLDPFTLHGGRMINSGATLIRVDVTRGPAVARVDHTVLGDAAAVASALLDGVDRRDVPESGWRAEVADEIAEVSWEHESYLDAGTADRIDPRTLARVLAGLLPRERTVVLDGGHFIGWPAMYWPVPDPSAMVFLGAAFQTIGLGLAAAVGAHLGRPDRALVVALGDGGTLMGMSELETLIRTARSALVVIYDDAGYGFEVHMYGPQGADISTASFTDTDFAGVARALGAEAVTVRSSGDLGAVVHWQERGCPGTLVLDCKVVPTVVGKFLTDMIHGH